VYMQKAWIPFYGNACALFVVSLVCLLVVCKVTGYPTWCCLSMCVWKNRSS